MKAVVRSGLIAILVVGSFGCSRVISSAIDSAARKTGEGIGTAVGQKTGQAAGNAVSARFPSMWTPDMSAIYVNYMFTLAFHSGSYDFPGTEYKPGEWTRWRMTSTDNEGKPPEMERAFIKQDDKGRQWWRVKYVIEDDNNKPDSMVVEMLFDPSDGQVLRMRGKMPGETEAKEMPVEQGTYTYVQPTRLTEESMEGAKVGDETISTPAGSFATEHIRYGSGMGGTLDWWLSDKVPGRMVKYGSTTSSSGDASGPDPYNWTLELIAYGTGAKSELGVQ
ncbi:MAG TPA: hypothetical protein VJ957_11645 [Longimicrobiales bacterium]|nr:hypothetical protein [Longimicrobiales bacterium]